MGDKVGDKVGDEVRVPAATYRLQFNQQFTFEQAAQILDYLDDLGVSDCYASPLFQAGPQSTHGYDICEFNNLNPRLGTPKQFESLAASIRSRKMGLLLDVVPNHMGCDCSNSWWWDVLANGRISAFAEYFDIDWEPPHTDLREKVLLPILEDHYGKVLEAGKLRLVFTDGAFRITYYENSFPVSLRSSLALLSEVGRDSVDKLLSEYNGTAGDVASFEGLHALLQAQHYRLAYWKIGSAEINYRRFFDVTGLVSVRMERAEVFEASHRLVFQMIAAGQVTGLRIDHPDGLWDPRGYFRRLQNANPSPLFVVAEKILSGDEQLPEDWPVQGTTGYDFLNRLNGLFVATESAAQMDQTYRAFTGINEELRSIIYAAKDHILNTSLKSELSALAHRLRQIGKASRQGCDITLEDFRAAIAAVVVTFPIYRTYVDEGTKSLPDTQRGCIQHAVEEARKRRPEIDPVAFDFLGGLLMLEVPRDLDGQAQLDARQFVMRFQQLTGPVMAKGLEDTAFYRFNRLVSLNEVGGDPGCFGTSPEAFHQFNRERAEHWPHSLLATATHDTKRGEDVRARINVISELPQEWRTAVEYWREINRGLKREVDGHPAPSANDEYLLYQTIVGAWPAPGEMQSAECRVSNGGQGPKRRADLALAPALAHGDEVSDKVSDKVEIEFRKRVRDYMLKAAREAKVETNWLSPNTAYEEALSGFVDGILQENSPFLEAMRDMQQRMAFFGRFNSLSQTVLKLTCPGVPDIYQGTELWDLSLVDPDNRHPVDYELRRKLLASELSVQEMGSLLAEDPQGRLKLHVIQKLLHLRRNQHALFARGSYMPIALSGPQQKHVIAFGRVLGGERIIVLASRLMCTLMKGEMKAPVGDIWQNTLAEALSANAQMTDAFTGRELDLGKGSRLDLAEVFAALPFAVLQNPG